jgi:hypothetical protein
MKDISENDIIKQSLFPISQQTHGPVRHITGLNSKYSI